jgi:hypothetical protein
MQESAEYGIGGGSVAESRHFLAALTRINT